jgi:RNA polymerase sigma-70 factor, ECF subfamily
MDTKKTLSAAQQGNREAITRLLMEHRGFIAAIVTRFIREREVQRDVIQDVFVKVIKNIRNFSGKCAFTTWLYRLTVNECVDTTRKLIKKKETLTFLSDSNRLFEDTNAPDGFAAISDRELRLEINNVVQQLPLDNRTAFSLFYLCGYSGKEAAAVMKIRIPNFFMKLKTARDTVRQKLIAKGWQL